MTTHQDRDMPPCARSSGVLTLAAMWAACVALASCSMSAAPVEVRNARSPAMPPGSSTIAVYADIRANQADTLVGVATPVADAADMHATEEHDGTLQMRPLAEVRLAAGERVKFEPGGKHIMLSGVRQVLPVGTQFPLSLRFTVAGDVAVQVKVVAPGDSP